MSHKSTILIVDDEPIGRQLIDAILYKEGYNLEFAENGKEAFEKAKALNPDLILLDVMMPEVDGFEVCQMLRADKNMVNVPIILVTALDDIDSRIRGLEAGADDYISKPFDRLELLARIKIITRLNKYRKNDNNKEGHDNDDISMPTAELLNTIASEINNINGDINVLFPESFLELVNKEKKNINIYDVIRSNDFSRFYLCGSKLNSEESIISLYLSSLISKSDSKNIDSNLKTALGAFKTESFKNLKSICPYCLIIDLVNESKVLSVTGFNNDFFLCQNDTVELIEGKKVDLKNNKEDLAIETKSIAIETGTKIFIFSGINENIEIEGEQILETIKKIISENINHNVEKIRDIILKTISDRSELTDLVSNIVIVGISF